ncbi:TonB-dependent siderophore receptor [Horticoccus sp. 23ND18S-11]|uniref:TonB-dependent siderophore receptor n=1 Tax=Horticoccus sp. 23ND18S-11 TaxID=3391832 RepID=UPI0039C9074B
MYVSTFASLPPARWAVHVLVLASAALSAHAAAPVTARSDEAVQLSTFTVTADDDRGYYAPSAISGTRTKTELLNLPMNLNVLTEQFIKDIGATDLVDIVTFTAGLAAAPATSGDTNGGDTTGFSLRGFGTHVPYRNGFRRLRIVDTTNIARVEVIKGPSSVLYGTAFAGGSVNYVTKRPEPTKRITELTLRTGSYDLFRSEIDVNLPVIPKKLAVRFVGALEDSDSWSARAHTDLWVLNPVATYWFRPDSYITVEYERTKKSMNGYRSALPYHPLMDFQTMGFPIDESWNTHAAGDYMDNFMAVFSAELVHRFTPYLTLRGNYTSSSWKELTRRNGDSIGLVTANGYASSPWLQPIRMSARQLNAYSSRGSWDEYYQAELVNNFSVKGVASQTLFGVQRSVETFRSLFSTLSPGFAFGGRAAVNWQLYDPSTWRITEETEANVTGPNPSGLDTMGRSRFDTMYLTNQLSFWSGRLRTMLGYRIDKFKSDGHGPKRSVTGAALVPVWSQAELPAFKTPQVGLLFKVTERLSLFAQYSESVVNLFLTQQRREDGTRFMPTPGKGEGYDIGIKGELMDNRVSFTASVFKIDNANIIRILAARADPEAPGLTFNPADQGGVQRSEGFDVDLRLRPFKTTQVILGYANIDAFVLEATDFVTVSGQPQLTRKGHQLANAPKRTTSLWVRQELGSVGGVKGLWIGGGFRFVGNRATSDTYNVIDYTTFINTTTFTGGRLVEGWRLQSYTVGDVSFGGRFELGGVRYGVSGSVRNVTDERYLIQRFHFGAPRTFELRFSTSF